MLKKTNYFMRCITQWVAMLCAFSAISQEVQNYSAPQIQDAIDNGTVLEFQTTNISEEDVLANINPMALAPR
jgi:hypothetical protein